MRLPLNHDDDHPFPQTFWLKSTFKKCNLRFNIWKLSKK